MKLAPNWRAVLRHAWSVRIIAGSIILNALAAALMVGNALPISLAALFILTFVVNAGTLVSQFVAQRDIREGTR